jgi:hypothetical protein
LFLIYIYGEDKKAKKELEGRIIPTIRTKSSMESFFEEENDPFCKTLRAYTTIDKLGSFL